MAHETLKVEVTVTKEFHELMQGVVNLLRTIKQVTADGFQPGQDIPTLWALNVVPLQESIKGINLIGDELRHDPGCAIRAVAVGVTDIVDVFVPHT